MRMRQLKLETLENRALLTTLMVATTGDDSNADGSPERAFRTLQAAVDRADPGDEIVMRAGTYDGGVTIRDPNITVRSFEGERAKIVAPIDDPNIQQVIRFHIDADGGRLSGLELQGGYYYAVKTESNWNWGVPDDQRRGASNIIIEDSILHGSGRDVIKLTPGSDDVIIRRNEIYDSGLRHAGNADGIDNVNGDRMIVRDNYIHDIATNGLYAKGGSIGSVIERNLIRETGSGGVMVGFYTDIEWFDTNVNPEYFESIDTIVRNNVILDTTYAGVGLYASKSPRVFNNTLINVGRTGQAGILTSYVDHYTGATTFTREANVDPVVINNLVVQPDGASTAAVYLRAGSIEGDFTFGHNWYHRPDAPPQFQTRLTDPSAWRISLDEWMATIGAEGSREGDPRLDDNLHLSPQSALIDAGRLIAEIVDDYDGSSRQGNLDIGADEFSSVEALIIPPPPGTVGTGAGQTGDPPRVHYAFDRTAYRPSESVGTLDITVTRSDSEFAEDVRLQTLDGAGVGGQDFTSIDEILSFAVGQSSKVVSVEILDDTIDETDESFQLILSDVTGDQTLATSDVTIVDDDDPVVDPPDPEPPAGDPSTFAWQSTRFEVSEDEPFASVTIVRTSGTGPAEVWLKTYDHSATAGEDYVAVDRMVAFATDENRVDVEIPILDDALVEDSERVTLTLLDDSGWSIQSARLIIHDNDQQSLPSTFAFSTPVFEAGESDGQALITVVRTSGEGAATVRIKTDDHSAVAGEDYVGVDQDIVFAADQTQAQIPITLIDDDMEEQAERVTLTLFDDQGQIAESARLNIVDNDQPAQTPSTFAWQSRRFSARESDGQVLVTILRTSGTGPAQVRVKTYDHSAKSGSDFVGVDRIVHFADGQNSVQIAIELIDDAVTERRERATLTLLDEAGWSIGSSRLVIADDDCGHPSAGWFGTWLWRRWQGRSIRAESSS